MQLISKEDILNNWENEDWVGWHSHEYVKAKARNKKIVRDDKYLRENILTKIPITTEIISLVDIWEHWHDAEWWKINFHNVVNIFDKMYVKKGIKANGGVYNSWLSRLVQYIITRDAESAISKKRGYNWNEAGHSYIHTGMATSEEVKPDFVDKNGTEVELKVCENEGSIVYHYFKKLKNNFNYIKQYDFHGADIALFMTKTKPHKLYEVKLDSIESLKLDEAEIIDLDTIDTVNGKIINIYDLPAVPSALLFGLTPTWAKVEKKRK